MIIDAGTLCSLTLRLFLTSLTAEKAEYQVRDGLQTRVLLLKVIVATKFWKRAQTVRVLIPRR